MPLYMFKPFAIRPFVWGCLVLAGALVGCRDATEETDSDRALRRKLERQAAARPPEASLRLGVIHHLDGIPSGGPVEWTMEGTTVQIEEAYLVVSAIEAHACEPGVDDYKTPAGPRMLNDLSDWVVSHAYAHVPSSATRLGTPFVENLLGESGRAQIIGSIAPPPAAYCELHAIVAPADRDVANSTSVRTEAIRGKSLLVRGRTRVDGADDWEDFEFGTDSARAIELRAINPSTGESPLVLDSSTASAMLLIDKRVDPTLFEVAEYDTAAANTILERLIDRFEIHTF